MLQKNAAALLQHRMIMKQNRLTEDTTRPGSGTLHDPQLNEHKNGKVHMTETKIYVGLNDAETRKQRFETTRYLGMLKNICQNYHVAFSVDIEEGGYFHEDGEYTEETSLILLLIDADWDVVVEIAKDLCAFFHQESVLVTEDHIDGCFVHVETLK